MESRARAEVAAAKREATTAVKAVTKLQGEAEGALSSIREAAAEQGVTQNAIYFETEADNHEIASKTWRKATIWAGSILGAAAIGSLFLHKIPFLKPTDTYEAVQLGISKFILFGLLSYALVLCARNFMTHKHNVVVNKHKQNALLTFKALVDAASASDKQDIVLDRASDAIFALPSTGFSKDVGMRSNNGTALMRTFSNGSTEE